MDNTTQKNIIRLYIRIASKQLLSVKSDIDCWKSWLPELHTTWSSSRQIELVTDVGNAQTHTRTHARTPNERVKKKNE